MPIFYRYYLIQDEKRICHISKKRADFQPIIQKFIKILEFLKFECL